MLHFFKKTLTNYQCVSIGCFSHVVKSKRVIDNQYVTNITCKDTYFSPNNQRKTPKNTQTCQILREFDDIFVECDRCDR